MMNELKQKFLDLSPRDQLMVVVCTLALLVYLLIFVVLLPMRSSAERLEVRNRAALEEQQTVRQLAGQVIANQQTQATPTGDGTLNGLLNESLRQFGLRMENFQPSGNTARVRLAPSEFNKVVAWLHEMEIKHSISIRDLTITAAESPGAVLVNLQLQQGE